MLASLAMALVGQSRPEPDWLPVLEAPRDLYHRLTLPRPRQPGSELEVHGRVVRADGKTPAAGVIVYFHHTDARGIYPSPQSATGWARFHGTIRGWLKTNAQGEFVLRTTRPAPYPGGTEPAHIHAYGLAPGSRTGFFFEDILFEGDPLINESHWQRVRRFGTQPYKGMRVRRGADGMLRGQWTFRMPAQ